MTVPFSPRLAARPAALAQTNRLLLVGAILLLCGCAGYDPQPLDPAAILHELRQATWQTAAAAPSVDGMLASDAAWQPENGLNADEVAWVAVCLNPALRESLAAQGIAMGDLIAAGLWPNPELDAGLRFHTAGAAKIVEAGLGIELLRWEERAANRESTQAAVLAARHTLRQAAWEVRCAAREGYWRVVAGRSRVELKTVELTLARQWAEQVRTKQDRGAATALDRQLAAMRVFQIQLEQVRLRQAAAAAERSLCRVMGVSPNDQLPLEIPAQRWAGASLPAMVADWDEILPATPTLARAAAEYRQAEGELRAAVARQYPGLRIGPAAEFEYDGSWSSFLGLGLAFDIPLFHRNQGEIARLSAARAVAREAYRRKLHGLCADLAEAIAEARAAQSNLALIETEILPQAEALQTLAEKSFLAGNQDVLEYLEAQAAFIAIQDQRLEAQIADRLATLQVERVLGQPLQTVIANGNRGEAGFDLPPPPTESSITQPEQEP